MGVEFGRLKTLQSNRQHSRKINTMTKIEEQRAVILNLLAIGDNAANELLDKFESAIREQVVIDALPKKKGKYLFGIDLGIVMGWNECVDNATQRLTTREEVERPYVELLMELAGIALPYMTTEQKQKLNSLTDNK